VRVRAAEASLSNKPASRSEVSPDSSLQTIKSGVPALHLWFAADKFAIQMNKKWVLTQGEFDSLLSWLDPDPEQAGRKYEAIRTRLIKIFTSRGCREAEDIADETINRVTARVAEVAREYSGDPALYFYGVAQKVLLEYGRKTSGRLAHVPVDSASITLSTPPQVLVEDIEPEYQCLEHCLSRLPPENRGLVERYYQQDKQAKIDHRKMLATELGIALNALRIRAHRIRQTLQRCVVDCLEQQPVN
jgi:DNA-directed RNA polymerase specialized sigma24 family protein